jgi:ADP-ribose pyrophosphatase YjhB (NUDIX family)
MTLKGDQLDFRCPGCGARHTNFRNPFLTVDIIIECEADGGRKGLVLIKRKNPPLKWALPGGFVDYGESLEAAAVREAKEETSLDVELEGQFHSYSDPDRDPRFHTVTAVFLAKAKGDPIGADDATQAALFDQERLPELAFDHSTILRDYYRYLAGEDPWS